MARTDIVRLARAADWQVLHLSTADQREWGDVEATWRRGRQQWLLDHPHDDRGPDVQDTLDAQTVEVDGFGPVLFCRGAPRDDAEVVLVDTRLERRQEVFAELPPR